MKVMLDAMSESDRTAAETWFDALPAKQAKAVLKALTGRRG
jgi:hypothetical protein